MNRLLTIIAAFVFGQPCFAGEINIKKAEGAYGDPQEFYEIAKDHDKVIFYTLEPSMPLEKNGPAGRDKFHGYIILGKKEVNEFENKKTILEYFGESIKSNPTEIIRCFNPRHGIRIKKDDRSMDIVICFQCSKARIYSSKSTTILIEGEGKVFNEFAKKMGLVLSKN